MALLTEVIIDGNTFSTGYIVGYKLSIKSDNNGDNGSVRITKRVDDVMSLQQMQVVTIKRGDGATDTYTIFRGRIRDITDDGSSYVLTLRGKLLDLGDDVITQTFDVTGTEGGKISNIIETLITDAGMTATIADSGDATLQKQFIIRNQTRIKRIRDLIKILGWQIYYDPTTDSVISGPDGTISYSTALEVGVNVGNVPSWITDGSKMANKFIIEGKEQLFTTQEAFNGDSSTTEFSLAFKPSDRGNFLVTVGGTEQTGGISESTASPDYTVDAENRKIIFTVAPTTGTGNITVDYAYLQPITVIGQDDDSIQTYGRTITKQVNRRDITTVADADKLLSQLLEQYSTPEKKTTLQIVNAFDIKPGVLVTVQDGINGVSGDFIVTQVTYNYPSGIDEVSIGSKALDASDVLGNFQERIELLERENKNTDIVNQLIPAFESVDITEVFELWSEALKAGVLYWEDGSQGSWGLNWNDGTAGTQTLLTRLHPFNKYYEDFRDNDLVDTGNTTCTVDTTNHELQFTNGEVYQSKVVFVDDREYNKARWRIERGQITTSVTGWDADTSLNAGVIANYALEGDATDDTGSFDGSAIDVTYGTGIINNCGVFNGTTSFINTGIVPSGSSLSLNAFFKTTYKASQQYIVGVYDGIDFGYDSIRMYLDTNGYANFYFRTASSGNTFSVTGSTDLADGEWHMMTLVWNGSTPEAFVDNVSLGTGAVTTAYEGVYEMFIGAFNDHDPLSPLNFFNGSIDEVTLFSTALSADDRTTLYNSGAGQQYLTNSLTYELSADGGSTFTTIPVNQVTYTDLGTSTTDGVVLKITSTGINTLSFDDAFERSVPWLVEVQ